MSFLKFVQDKESWLKFIAEEEEKEYGDERLISYMQKIVDKEEYLSYDESFLANFPLAKVKRIGEYNTSKKRTVYVYPKKYRTVLKMMSYYILSNYGRKFAKNSIAYTKGRSVRSAFKMLKSFNLTEKDTIYKNDFSDYFNSIDIDLLDKKVKDFLDQDVELYSIIMSLLREPRVVDRKEIKMPQKGVMAGSPIAGILANIFMDDLDKKMLEKGYKYIRYADDTLIVGKEALDFFVSEIEKKGVGFNHKKTEVFNITTGLTFLGFKHIGKTVDISDKARKKMKSRFKRRAKWYRRWMFRKNVPVETAVKDYIKKINYKLYSEQDDSINWSRWYLPNINTDESLKYLDQYFVRAIRYLYTGHWNQTSKHYSIDYETIKKLGYVSLVNTYYKAKR